MSENQVNTLICFHFNGSQALEFQNVSVEGLKLSQLGVKLGAGTGQTNSLIPNSEKKFMTLKLNHETYQHDLWSWFYMAKNASPHGFFKKDGKVWQLKADATFLMKFGGKVVFEGELKGVLPVGWGISGLSGAIPPKFEVNFSYDEFTVIRER